MCIFILKKEDIKKGLDEMKKDKKVMKDLLEDFFTLVYQGFILIFLII